jgi:hypothetical protein
MTPITSTPTIAPTYTLTRAKQGREKRQGGWMDRDRTRHWYQYGRGRWRPRPALVMLVGDGGEIRVPATCLTVEDALAWLTPSGAVARQGHLYFVPVSAREQARVRTLGPAPIAGDDRHIAQMTGATTSGLPVYRGRITHVGGHAGVDLPVWCRAVPPRTFATQSRWGD